MIFPNLVAVVTLYPLVMKITKNYVARQIKNKNVESILSYDKAIQTEMAEKLETAV